MSSKGIIRTSSRQTEKRRRSSSKTASASKRATKKVRKSTISSVTIPASNKTISKKVGRPSIKNRTPSSVASKSKKSSSKMKESASKRNANIEKKRFQPKLAVVQEDSESITSSIIAIEGKKAHFSTTVSGIKTVQELWEESNKELLRAFNEIEADIAISPELDIPQEKIDEFKKNIESPKFTWTGKYVNIGPSEFYKTFFHGLKAGHLNVVNMRKIFEKLSNAATQCKYADRHIPEEKIPTRWDTCYICGIQGRDKYNELSVFECEHILPAFTSLGHYGLIENSLELSEKDIEFYRYEYANAHQCCNQIKKESKWIIFNENEKKYVINKAEIISILERIFKTDTNYDCSELRRHIKTFNVTIESRTAYITKNYLEPLVEMINRSRDDMGEVYETLARIRQINALNLSYKKIAHALLDSDYSDIKPIVELSFEDSTTVQIEIQKDYLLKHKEICIKLMLSKMYEMGLDNSEVLKKLISIFNLGQIKPRGIQTKISSYIDDVKSPFGIEIASYRENFIKDVASKITLPIKEDDLKKIIDENLDGLRQTYKSAIDKMFESIEQPEIQSIPKQQPFSAQGGNITGGGIAIDPKLLIQYNDISQIQIEVNTELKIIEKITTRSGRISRPELFLEKFRVGNDWNMGVLIRGKIWFYDRGNNSLYDSTGNKIKIVIHNSSKGIEVENVFYKINNL